MNRLNFNNHQLIYHLLNKMARIIINGITHLTVILFVLALCALFPTDVQANNTSLSEQFCKCERKFWFKSLSQFKKSIKSKCLKDHRQKRMKRHQSRLCNNKSHDRKELLAKWQKFSDCRCESAMGDFKEKGFFICYQTAQVNKVTGEFLGELSLYEKKGQPLKVVGLKFPHEIKVLNDDQWKKVQGFYHSKKGPRFIEKRDQFSIKKYYISGKISKSESMNKICSDKISPSKYLLIFGNGKSEIVKSLSKNEKVANIPFSGFIHNNIKSIIFQKVVPQEEKDDDEKKKKIPADENEIPPNSDQKTPTNGNQPTTVNPDEVTNTALNTPTSTTPVIQEANDKDNKVTSGKELVLRISGILFGGFCSVAAVFVAFNTYERRRLRNRHSHFAPNSSLAKVPDYNSYNGGRAY